MNTVVAKPFENHSQPRGSLHCGEASILFVLPFNAHPVEKIVADHTARNLSLVHRPGSPGRQYVKRCQGRHRTAHLFLNTDQFLKFACIKTKLGDDVIGTGSQFSTQLGILGPTLCFGVFKRRYPAADKQVFRITHFLGLLDGVQQTDQVDRIQIKHRGALLTALTCIVSIDSQDVAHAHHG